MYKVTYGAELEMADIDTRIKIPDNVGDYDYKDYSIANSNGVGNDPLKKWTIYGSEIHITPCLSIDEILQKIFDIYKLYKNKISFNYTCNFHIHIGLDEEISNDLYCLKRIAFYIYKYMPEFIYLIDPLPADILFGKSKEYINLYNNRKKRRKRSHHRLMRDRQYSKLMESKTIEDFKKAFGDIPSQRYCVNMKSLFKENRRTIEFRHFSMSNDIEKIRNAFDWCDKFIYKAINNKSMNNFLNEVNINNFPNFISYNFKIDKIFVQTGLAFTHSRKKSIENIKKLIDAGEIDAKTL